MNPVFIHCLKPGLLTTVQDQGRMGYQKYGVAVGGAMDKRSARLANYLVGNNLESPVLEITFSGPTLHFNGACQIAITGADISATIDGVSASLHETLDLKADSLLTFGRRISGCRTYLAVGGEWKVRPWLGSASAPLKDAHKTTPDSVVGKGSHIKIQPRPFIATRMQKPSTDPGDPFEIRILPGPEFDQLNRRSIGHFFSQRHRVTPQSNRMGYRLAGTIPFYQSGAELISSGCLPGTIQITREGQAIILMADAQTTGGYPRVGQVIASDLDVLAQAVPGDLIRFVLIDRDDALRVQEGYNAMPG